MLVGPLPIEQEIRNYIVSPDNTTVVYEVSSGSSEPSEIYSIPLFNGTPTLLAKLDKTDYKIKFRMPEIGRNQCEPRKKGPK